MPTPLIPATPSRLLAEQALSRAAGAPLLNGNAVDLLIDAVAHYEAWLAAICGARQRVLLENYIIRDDEVGRAFRDALVERAQAGVFVAVVVDWLGCLGQSRGAFWAPLRAAGGEVRVFNPLQLGEPLGWVSRDHRKLLVVDGVLGFLSGVCISAKWLGDPARGVPPWRDTGVALRGPAVAELEAAFAQSWGETGVALRQLAAAAEPAVPAGNVSLRLIATQPSTAGTYRLDQLIAAMARKTLWLTDAYFVGLAPYVQALVAAARDGVDVRLLVPGSSDIPIVAGVSRSGYRPLLKAGIRVFEWNGSMLHAKTAVADGQWARVGSSNLNIASWLGNRELDVAVEDAGFAGQLAAQYEQDLGNATEIVLASRRRRRGSGGRERVRRREARPPHVRHAGGSSGRAAAGALRIANSVGAALANRRVLDDTGGAPLAIGTLVLVVLAAVAFVWPAWIGWPFGALAAWFALNLAIRSWRVRRRRWRERRDAGDD
ncbi:MULTISPECIES: phospholipase D-like domain-containing protein [Rhodanobacter]|uniref:phospholipase D-like domain-containing protein n=1 Tax=Rhodanobacter TaxID=75309 RepID=UPI0003F9AE3A|nr:MULTISPECIES: phospholipase D-like domain-containing protein [Rhodanobacter]KZC18682.1 cardiolipin synthase B [Rhodanobacter denitrificans]UJJ49493.1 phospholipase D-like domain-containing protein [Rhodanobacter denitrificans]UJM92207.1 phospholipase D-like domain-containing protein [Rhodanobacter denitrificans]UJM95736.1 phospholipase D-like domain-containing protein [Rhodanobacter denitrificans]UJN21433.1 phospholipase D-like domain-containing protein [Rhodanobacter denitrificans]